MTNAEKSYLTYAVIQSGYCVFGAGESEQDAYLDAAQWLEEDENGEWTADRVERECKARPNDGDLTLINRSEDTEYFDRYMRGQGGYTFDGTGWTSDE